MKTRVAESHRILADLGLTPDWLRFPAAIAYSQLPQSTIYELINAGELHSFVIKSHPKASRGVRFVSKTSIDRFLARKAAEAGINEQEVVA
jgi:predicted DNA-binding transcriptional regulator AlpA